MNEYLWSNFLAIYSWKNNLATKKTIKEPIVPPMMIPSPPYHVPYKNPPINDKRDAIGKLQTIKKL